MGSNLEYKGVKEVLEQLQRNKQKEKKELSQKEVTREWNRLASFMTGVR